MRGATEIAVPSPELILGRQPGLPGTIDAESVSRRHARLTWDGSVASLVDLGSKNGTFVNGVRIAEAVSLEDEDEIRFGLVTFTYRAPPHRRIDDKDRGIVRPVSVVQIDRVDSSRDLAELRRPPVPPLRERHELGGAAKCDVRWMLGRLEESVLEAREAKALPRAPGRTVAGRIAAIVDDEHNRVHEEKIGFFGFFECEEDRDVASALFARPRRRGCAASCREPRVCAGR